MKNIPAKDRKEWKDLLTDDLNISLKNFFFQMKVTQTKNLLKSDKITLEAAIDDIYNLCVKFSKAKNMAEDIESIFGTEEEIPMPNTQVSTTNNNSETVESNKESVIVNHDNQVNSIKFKEVKHEEVDTNIESEIERIKREAAERERAFEQRKLELQNKIEKEQKEKVERKNRILEAEERAKERLLLEREAQKADLVKKEKEALVKATNSRSKTLKKTKKKVKKSFLQRLFNL